VLQFFPPLHVSIPTFSPPPLMGGVLFEILWSLRPPLTPSAFELQLPPYKIPLLFFRSLVCCAPLSPPSLRTSLNAFVRSDPIFFIRTVLRRTPLMSFPSPLLSFFPPPLFEIRAASVSFLSVVDRSPAFFQDLQGSRLPTFGRSSNSIILATIVEVPLLLGAVRRCFGSFQLTYKFCAKRCGTFPPADANL